MLSCPNCKKDTHVDVESARSVSFSKLLYGIKQHRYLDTKMYPCCHCKKEFDGYNKTSLELDAKTLVGYFNFYLATKYAVDHKLYSFIVSSPDTSPARIARHLPRMVADSYLVTMSAKYLHVVRSSKIRAIIGPFLSSKC